MWSCRASWREPGVGGAGAVLYPGCAMATGVYTHVQTDRTAHQRENVSLPVPLTGPSGGGVGEGGTVKTCKGPFNEF